MTRTIRTAAARQPAAVVLLVLCLVVSGCAAWRAAQVPMPSLSLPATETPAEVLLVLMPGAMEVPHDLVAQGFVDEVRRQGIAVDVEIADSHMGYFRDGSFPTRLREDVIEPARRRKPYRQIWLAGISLGGFGSLMYARRHPGEVHGIIALSPFIAGEPVWREVRQAGGLARWQPPSPLADGDWERNLVGWLQGYGVGAADRPALYLGWGVDDRLAESNAALGALLPPAQVFRAPGGHDWPAWKRLWRDMLAASPLPRHRTPKEG